MKNGKSGARMATLLKHSYSVYKAGDSPLMAFIICDDHNLSLEADEIGAEQARELMVNEGKPAATCAEKEIADFGKAHRGCSVRILQT